MGRPQDFSKSVIYHIRHMESKEVVYVGSTTNFPQRKAKHKYKWNKEGKEFSYPIYCHIRNNGGFDCFEVIPIKSLKLENKTELLIAEQEEIDKHRTLVNKIKAHMTIEDREQYYKQYWEEHKEELKEYNKQYFQEHKSELNEKRNQYKKQYYQENKEVIAEKKKLYYQENKEEQKQKHKLYYQEHSAELNEKRKQTVKCPICNSTVIRRYLKGHQRTKKCQEYLNK